MLDPLESAIKGALEKPGAYALTCADRSYIYKGGCRNVKERLKDHQAGRASRTKHRRPLWVVSIEYSDDYRDAFRRETWLKAGTGLDWLRQNISG